MRKFSLDAYLVYLIYLGADALISRMAFTAMLIYFVDPLGMNPFQLVLTGTALETAIFLLEIPTGIVADVYSRRLSILIGVTIIGVSLLMSSIPVIAVVLVAQAVWGLGYTFTSGATNAWLSDEIGEDAANHAFLRGSQIATGFGMVGVLASILLGSLDIRLPILIGGVMYLLLTAFLTLSMPETGFTPTPAEDRNTWKDMRRTFVAGANTVKTRPVIMNILMIGVIIGLFSEGYDRLYTAHLLDSFVFSNLGSFHPEPVVWFGAIRIVGSVLYLLVVESLIRRIDTSQAPVIIRTLQIINSLLIAALVTFALAGYFWLAVAAVLLIGILRSISYPLHEAWLNQGLDPKVRATVFSMAGQMDALGEIAGGPIVGGIATFTSIRVGLIGSAVLLTPALLILKLAQRNQSVELIETGEPNEIAEVSAS